MKDKKQSRNPFLFRGPIPTQTPERNGGDGGRGRNPFLFRGPIPTQSRPGFMKRLGSRNPFLFRGPIPTNGKQRKLGDVRLVSQSLLIQRSYSYMWTP